MEEEGVRGGVGGVQGGEGGRSTGIRRRSTGERREKDELFSFIKSKDRS